MDRLDLIERADPASVAPAQKRGGGAPIRGACVRVADIDREEFEEALSSALLCPGDERRQTTPLPRRVFNDDQIAHAGPYHRPGANTRHNVRYVRLIPPPSPKFLHEPHHHAASSCPPTTRRPRAQAAKPSLTLTDSTVEF